MCGRLACILSPDDICKACAYPSADKTTDVYPGFLNFHDVKYEPSYNLSPTQMVPVLIDGSHFADARQTEYIVTSMRWGLIPDWGVINSTHNMKLETMMDLTIPKTEMRKNHRGVLICDGYYEWKSFYKGNSQPYYFYNVDLDSPTDDCTGFKKPTMKIAAIFNKHIDFMGDMKITCSMITKEATPEISHIHNRMPVTLNSFEAVKMWINSKVPYRNSYDFLRQYDCKKTAQGETSKIVLQYHAVDKNHVNNSSCNTEKCIERITIKRQLSMDSWLIREPPKKK